MFDWLHDRAQTRRLGRRIYDSIVAQSRAEPFYDRLGVPDTVRGRFEVIVLHMFLGLERLRQEGGQGKKLARALIECFVTDMDDSMREIGISDLGVPRRVKRAAAAIYDRGKAYGAAAQSTAIPDPLVEDLVLHVYDGATVDPVLPIALADYVRRGLGMRADGNALAGVLAFPDIMLGNDDIAEKHETGLRR